MQRCWAAFIMGCKFVSWRKRAGIVLAAVALSGPMAQAADVTLLNVSYDPTRELYEDYNPTPRPSAFWPSRRWQWSTG